MRLIAAAVVLALSSLAIAGDDTTPAAGPPTPEDVAAKFFSKDETARAAAEKSIAAATPEFLRAILAVLRKTMVEPGAPLRAEPANEGTSGGEPDLPPPDPTTGTARGVSLELRFLDAPRDLLEPFGTPGFAGPPWDGRSGAAILDETQRAAILRAADKNVGIRILSAPRITVYDGQRATTEVLSKTEYIDDYDAEAGVAKPIVKTAVDGIVLDVRPRLSADAKSMRLDLSTKVRRLTKPIEEQQVSLPGVEKPVKVQRPELRTEEWSKSLTLADGGSMIVGGWKSDDPERKDRVTLILIEAKAIDLTEPGIEIKEPPPPGPDAPNEKPTR